MNIQLEFEDFSKKIDETPFRLPISHLTTLVSILIFKRLIKSFELTSSGDTATRTTTSQI